MVAQNIFPKGKEFIETFDFSDIASGLGFEIYWGIGIRNTSGLDTQLTPFLPVVRTVAPDAEESQQTGAGTTTVNFDTSTFNLPRTAKGTAYVNFKSKQTSGNAVSIKAQIAIVHADLTATNISAEFENNQFGTTAVFITDLLALPLTQTTIKKGEKLRLIMKIVVDATGGDGMLAHSHADELKLFMPFRIES